MFSTGWLSTSLKRIVYTAMEEKFDTLLAEFRCFTKFWWEVEEKFDAFIAVVKHWVYQAQEKTSLEVARKIGNFAYQFKKKGHEHQSRLEQLDDPQTCKTGRIFPDWCHHWCCDLQEMKDPWWVATFPAYSSGLVQLGLNKFPWGKSWAEASTSCPATPHVTGTQTQLKAWGSVNSCLPTSMTDDDKTQCGNHKWCQIKWNL